MLRPHGVHERNFSATWILITRLPACSESAYHLPSVRSSLLHFTRVVCTAERMGDKRGDQLAQRRTFVSCNKCDGTQSRSQEPLFHCQQVGVWMYSREQFVSSAGTNSVMTSAILKQWNEFRGKRYEIMRKNFTKRHLDCKEWNIRTDDWIKLRIYFSLSSPNSHLWFPRT
jgi:hypothetical protein